MKFEIASERSIILYLSDQPSEKTIDQLSGFGSLIELTLGVHLIDLVMSYTSILIIFNPLTTTHQEVKNRILSAINEQANTTNIHRQAKLIRLPVYYDPESGPDLERIALYHETNIEQVISRHCMNVYQVYAIGFAPGFAYLGEVDINIAMPRLTSPRSNVLKGSVGIADRQTAIYPAASPGGWNIIGRCPSNLFDPLSDPPMPFTVGDKIQFMPISKSEFLYLGGDE